MEMVTPELRVVEYQNEWIVKSRYPFAYEDPATSQLTELRERYRLEDVIRGGRGDWEQLLLLREWVHGRWDHGWSSARIDDALDVLGKAEQEHDFNCGYYSSTFTQCAVALGFQARRLGITKTGTATAWIAADEGNIGHAVAEAWVQDWHKWVVLDPDLNAHYEHGGEPLSALEVHRLWQAGRWRELRLVRGEAPFRTTTKPQSASRWGPQEIADIFADFTRNNVADYYASLRWELGNNLFSAAGPLPGLRWFDHGEPPQLVQGNRPILADHWTCEERDAYWTLNQAQIALRLSGEDLSTPVVRVEIEHSMPNLGRLLVKLAEDGPWTAYDGPFLWSMRPGKNVIEAKPVSAFGREGYTSRVVLRYLGMTVAR
jgi:Transglutaminase-like superfamily